MSNPWLDVPLADYEGHMSLLTIGQAQMRAHQFEALLKASAPGSVALQGVRLAPPHSPFQGTRRQSVRP